MIYLSGKASPHDCIGTIITFNGYNTSKTNYLHKAWAVDNGCFLQADKYSDEKYLKFLKRLKKKLFVCNRT